jgi:large subunit ribosomal protein L9
MKHDFPAAGRGNSMKMVFLTDVPSVAKEGDVKEVSNGYGRNFLLPKGFALPATPANMRVMEEKKRQQARKDAKTEAEVASLGSQLNGKEVTIKAKAGAEGHLHGAVTANNIADALQAAGINVDRRKIELAEPIHETGMFEVSIRLSKDVIPIVKVNVQAEA